MLIFQSNIAQGIGDNIMAKCYADLAKNKYEKIFFTHHAPIVQKEKNNSPEYWDFLGNLGSLFFSKHPYVYNNGQYRFRGAEDLIRDFNIVPEKPQHSEYVPLLCKGNSLNLGQEYIVISTKLRYFDKGTFLQISQQLWQVLKELSHKYKIVILGEREVEMCHDYLIYGSNQIFSIYEQIIVNLSQEKILDLTIPALGITSPTIRQVQQDCLIMNQAKFVITFGIGGNFCMSMAVANMIGYRIDNENISNTIFQKTYSDAFVTKDWNAFINKMKEYL